MPRLPRPLLLLAALAACRATPTHLGTASAALSVDTDLRRETLRWDAGGANTAVVFRCRADGVSSSPAQTLGGAQVHTVSRPAPFGAFRYLDLDGVDDGVLGASPLVTQTDRGLTLQAWFRATGSGRLFANTEGYRGYALEVKDGHLRATYTCRVADDTTADAADRHFVEDPTPVTDGRWHHAAFQLARIDHTPSGSTVSRKAARARLYLDGKQIAVAYQWFDQGSGFADFAFWDSAGKPAVGAEPDAGALASAFFAGQIHAVAVHDYPVDHDVLASPPLRDGGKYFGLPSYHDYLDDPEHDGSSANGYADRTWNLARRITLSDRAGAWPDLAKATARVGIPLLNDKYVPQGLGMSPDGTKLYVASYYSDATLATSSAPSDAELNPPGGTCGQTACPVAVAEADLGTFTVTRVFLLADAAGTPSAWHVGGVVAARGSLYAGHSQKLHRFDPAAAVLIDPGDATHGQPPVYRLPVAETFAVKGSSSGLAYDAGTDSIYMINYKSGADPASDNDIHRYALTATGAVAHPSTTTADDTYHVPESQVDEVQGLLRVPGAKPCFLLSSSAGGAPSELHAWCAGDAKTRLAATVPCMSENVVMAPDGMVWVLFESGAHKYQKRAYAAQYADCLHPYVLGLPAAALGLPTPPAPAADAGAGGGGATGTGSTGTGTGSGGTATSPGDAGAAGGGDTGGSAAGGGAVGGTAPGGGAPGGAAPGGGAPGGAGGGQAGGGGSAGVVGSCGCREAPGAAGEGGLAALVAAAWALGRRRGGRAGRRPLPGAATGCSRRRGGAAARR